MNVNIAKANDMAKFWQGLTKIAVKNEVLKI